MSNQSGITANEELLSTIGSLANDRSTGNAVVAVISQDASTVQLSSVLKDVQELKSFVSSANHPLYVFLRYGSQIVFISYVPEDSPVRAKMLYASTKNTILRQVGSNHISKQLLVSQIDELDPSSWDSGAFNEPAPLTEAEQISASISKEQQNEAARGGRKLVSQTGGTSHTLSFKISSAEPIPAILDQFNLVSFKIDAVREEVELLGKSTVSKVQDIPGLLNKEHPTYNIYRNSLQQLHFIYSCPSGSKVKERMLYASNKSGFIKHLSEVDHLIMEKVFEIGDADELELSQLEKLPSSSDEPATPVPGQLKFTRPKRPGRRS